MNLRKLLPTVLAAVAVLYLSSCNDNDDPTPCTDQSLAAFEMVLMDEEEELILDNEEFDPENLQLFARDGEELTEIDFEVKTSSEEMNFISSIEMSELSLEDGISDFRIQWDDEKYVDFTYNVSASEATGCTVYSYQAQLDGEDLENKTSGNTTVYIISIEVTEEVSED